MALVAGVVVAVLTMARDDRSTSLASTIAFKQRCAVRYPDPCWQDPLTDAYGRAIGGAVRALAPAPSAVAGPNGVGLVGVDYRHCRQVSCATYAGPHLTPSNRRTTAFTSIGGAGAGGLTVDYWIYRPTIGWERVREYVADHELAGYARVPLLESADPVLVPLETLLGRDDTSFPSAEEPPWRGEIESRWGS